MLQSPGGRASVPKLGVSSGKVAWLIGTDVATRGSPRAYTMHHNDSYRSGPVTYVYYIRDMFMRETLRIDSTSYLDVVNEDQIKVIFTHARPRRGWNIGLSLKRSQNLWRPQLGFVGHMKNTR